MDAAHPGTAGDTSWGGAALAALSLNYLGVYPGNQDSAFHAAVTADPSYRAAFRAFAATPTSRARPTPGWCATPSASTDAWARSTRCGTRSPPASAPCWPPSPPTSARAASPGPRSSPG
ncbi:hypothetical protein ACFQ2B_02475 [Streptomyces stramineus]